MFSKACGTIAAVLVLGCGSALAADITVATVNNSQMVVMQRLSSQWEKQTGNQINWVVLEENVLRQRVTTDIATNGGQFDVMTIGVIRDADLGQAELAGTRWVIFLPVTTYNDVFQSVRAALSSDGKLYAVPFYAESSFTYYRKDLFDQAGLKMPDQPKYYGYREVRRKAHRQEQGAVWHLPARQARLGREHGVLRHAGEHVRRALVRPEVEGAARHAGRGMTR